MASGQLMKRSFVVLLVITLFIGGVASGVVLTRRLFIVNFDYVADGVYSGQRPLAIPTLQTITDGTRTMDEALERISAYYDENRERLQSAFAETDEQRLRALFVMYTTHISHLYGPATDPADFLLYLRQPYSHCGTYTAYQTIIARSMGLTTRAVSISGDTHVWLEALIGDQWEIFDATLNVWIDHAGIELERGAPRTYRAFYTPLLDPSYPHDGYTLGGARLRSQLPGLGLYYSPLAYLEVMN
jgi:transglutaminase-like putative cysteine protease